MILIVLPFKTISNWYPIKKSICVDVLSMKDLLYICLPGLETLDIHFSLEMNLIRGIWFKTWNRFWLTIIQQAINILVFQFFDLRIPSKLSINKWNAKISDILWLIFSLLHILFISIFMYCECAQYWNNLKCLQIRHCRLNSKSWYASMFLCSNTRLIMS